MLTKYGEEFVEYFTKYSSSFYLLNVPENSRVKVPLECVECNTVTIYTANTVKQVDPVCSECKLVATRENKLAKFISKSKKRFGLNTFNYTNFVFKNVDTPGELVCMKCDETFTQAPYSHLNSKFGCPKCVATAISIRLYKDLDAFKERISHIFGDIYDYTDTVYSGAQTSLVVKCKSCEALIEGVPGNIANRVRYCTCQGRTTGGFNPNKKALLYYLKVEYQGLLGYKIGITNKTVAERYKANKLGEIKVLRLWEYAVGSDARKEETALLREFRKYRWQGPDMLTDGNTEIFSKDVLALDGDEYE